MQPFRQRAAWVAIGLATPLVIGAADFSSWRHKQDVTVAEAGLVRLVLPPETLGAARSDLGDLRLLDGQNQAVPYAIERLLPEPARVAAAKSLGATLTGGQTELLIETGFTQAVERVTLQTTAPAFIKAVTVEGSADGKEWQPLARGLPIFRQAGSSQLAVALSAERWGWLRLIVDDRRSPPIAFTGATLQAAAAESPTEEILAEVMECTERDGVSRLRLRLPAANLYLAAVGMASSETLFTREVTLAWPRVTEAATNEINLASGTVYCLAADGGAASSNLTVRVEALAPARELILSIRNQDSPPLAVAGVRLRIRPSELVFRAPTAGVYCLLVGNSDAPAPQYDVASLGERFLSLPATRLKPGPLTANPDYRAPAALPGVQDSAATLDVSGWRFRKSVRVATAGVQRLELDLEVLAEARADLGDLRLIRGGTQVPYLRDAATGTHRLAVEASMVGDPKRPDVSRWRVKLSHPRLPLTELRCASPTALFQRRVLVFEEVTDRQRGVKQQRHLGQADWSRTPGKSTDRLVVMLIATPETDTLFVETVNGDNPPIALEQFEAVAPVPRLAFKSGESAADLFLYFGNPNAVMPRYDLSLVAAEVQAATKQPATLGAIEQMKPGTGWRLGPVGTGGPLMWIVLAVVGGALLILITRLLPKPPEETQPPQDPTGPSGPAA